MPDEDDRPRLDEARIEQLRDAAAADPDIPSFVRDLLATGAHLDELRLSERGQWLYNGAAVAHPRVQRLFSKSLRRTASGTWVLEIPPYTFPVLVDGTPRFIHRLRGELPEGELGSGDWLPLDLSTLETDGGELLVAYVDGEPARFVGAAYQVLLDNVDADDLGWFVDWHGRRVRIAPFVGAPLAGTQRR